MARLIAVGILLMFITWFLTFLIYAVQVKKVGPNQALIVFGRENVRVITGGRSFVWPIVEQASRLSLEIIPLDFTFADLFTYDNERITITGKAQVKVDTTEEAILNAATHFLSKSQQEVKHIILEVLEADIRQLVSQKRADELTEERTLFNLKVQEAGSDIVTRLGLVVVSFNIKNIS